MNIINETIGIVEVNLSAFSVSLRSDVLRGIFRIDIAAPYMPDLIRLPKREFESLMIEYIKRHPCCSYLSILIVSNQELLLDYMLYVIKDRKTNKEEYRYILDAQHPEVQGKLNLLL